MIAASMILASGLLSGTETAAPPSEGNQLPQIRFERPCGASPQDWFDAREDERTPPSSDPARPLQQPPYPPVSRRLNEEGTVVMVLLVNEQGEAAQARVEASSGYPALDVAALEGTKVWRFNPATLRGKPTCTWGRFAVTFRLTDVDPDFVDTRPIKPDALRLADLLFENGALLHEEFIGPLIRRPKDDVQLARDVSRITAASASFTKLRDTYARMISDRFTDDELAQLLAFYRTDVGKKWVGTSLEVGRESSPHYFRFIAANVCATLLVKSALVKGKARRDLQTTEVPTEFRAALPTLVASVQPYCECNTDAFMRQIAQATKSDADAESVFKALDQSGKCSARPALDW